MGSFVTGNFLYLQNLYVVYKLNIYKLMKKSENAMPHAGTTTTNHVAFWQAWLLLMAGIFLPLSALADQVTVADANGNELRYTFDGDGPATFTRVDKYSSDEAKAGHIIIADRVTDSNGTSHDVRYISGSVGNRSELVSIVFGQNIVSTGGPEGTNSDAFYSCRKLQSVTLNANLELLGSYTFQDCYSLAHVNLGDCTKLTTIKNNAFEDCDLVRQLTLPASVTTIERGAFYGIDSLRTFTFADGSPVTTIPQECFGACASLETLTLPEAVETVEGSAFSNCRALTEVTFGSRLTTFANDWYIFYNCHQLQRIVLPGANYPFTGGLWLPSTVVLYVHPDLVDLYRTSDYTKNRRVMAIGATTDVAVTTTEGGQLGSKIEALANPMYVQRLTVSGPLNGTDIDYLHGFLPLLEVLDLSSVHIVEGGEKYHRWSVSDNGTATVYSDYDYYRYAVENDVVGSYMFHNMPMLRSLQLPRATTAIGDYAMADDRRLATIGLGNAVTTIGRNAFCRTGLTSLVVPAGVTRLEAETFYDCNELLKVTLPDAITFVGTSCFSECDLLEDVNIPASVETIAEYAFYNNASRTTPIVLPATLKTVGNHAFMYNKVVRRITFSEGLETIGNYAFSNCNAVESLTLPESLTRIEYNAFEGCDSITEFRFPQSIKEVPDGVLYHCDKLQRVVLAEGTTRLGHSAFSYCPALADINIATMNTLTFTGRYVFENTGFTTITLPNSITEMDYCSFQGCKQLSSVNVPTGIDYVPYDFCEDCPELLSVTLHDGIRVVRHDAFYGCRKLRTIDLNDQITDIEYNAFRNCDSLRLSKLPAALTFIGGSAFSHTKSMTGAIEIPAGVKQIDYEAFSRSGITGVTLPEGITTWGTGLFAYCDSLRSVQLPKDIKRITNNMFEYCKSLRQIQIPDSVSELGYAAFSNAALESVTLPDSLRTIESCAFQNTQLREFRVPDGFRGDPGSYTWQGCKRLKTIYLGKNQDYTLIESFTCLSGCDSLQLLRIYAGTPPSCNQWYMGYRTKCVLEVPEDAVELYKAADTWKEFKEIRGFFQGDVLNDLDFAVLQKLYRELDGANWKHPWDLTNNHRSMGKWHGVLTVGDYITEIDLTGQGLEGELCDSLFLLPRIEKLNLSQNRVRASLTTLLANRDACTTLTEVNMQGNALTGDIYPFATKLPNLTRLDLSYNQLTEVSQPIPNEKLPNDRFARGFQFVDYQTKQVVANAPVADITPGIPAAIELNTVQTYRHEYGDYGYQCSDLYRHYLNKNGDWTTSDWELTKDSEGLWVLNSSYGSRALRAPKGVPVMYTHGDPWWSHLSFIVRFDWTDGDANADQTVDVTDLQSVIHYALHDGKPDGQLFNFTAADTNGDDAVNVSDIVGSVDYVLAATLTEPANTPYYNHRAPASRPNVLSTDGNTVVLTLSDAVAALQLTVTGATAQQLRVSEALQSQFSVAMRQVAGGVRIVAYSAEGRCLAPGVHQLLSGLPVGAAITDVRLSDSQARYLDVDYQGALTGIRTLSDGDALPDGVLFDLNGRRVGPWQSLPDGIYIYNGKKIKKITK